MDVHHSKTLVLTAKSQTSRKLELNFECIVTNIPL